MTDSTALEEIDPRNVLGMVPSAVRDIVVRVQETYPHYFEMSETELRREVNPSENGDLLRGAFWIEYRKAKDSGRRMMMSHVYDMIIERPNFYKFLEKPEQVAWLMRPPTNEYLEMEVENYRLRKEFSRILKVPLVEPDGKTVRIKEARLALDIYKMYADRLHGAVLQRVEKKIQNIPANDISGSADEIRQKIKELEAIQVDVKDPETSNEG